MFSGPIGGAARRPRPHISRASWGQTFRLRYSCMSAGMNGVEFSLSRFFLGARIPRDCLAVSVE
jgi:hypothetical protein